MSSSTTPSIDQHDRSDSEALNEAVARGDTEGDSIDPEGGCTEPINPDHLPGALKRKAIKGTFWVAIGQFAGQFIRLASSLILTRLLDQAVIGLMVPVNNVIRGLQMMSDVGIRQSMIQDEHGDEPHFYNTAWSIGIVRGVVLSIIALPIAIAIGIAYKEPQLFWVIPVASLSTAILGFRSTSLISLGRQIDMRRITQFALAAQMASLVITAGWALIDPSMRALVAGVIAGAVFNTVASFYLITDYHHAWHWDRAVVKKIWHFAKWMLPGTALAYFATQAYVLIVYPFVPVLMKGAFGVAVMIVEVPKVMAGRVSAEVIFPAMSRKQHLPREELREKILANRGKVLYAAAVAIALLAAWGDVPIVLLWSADYHAAGWMMPIMALGVWPLLLYRTTLPALTAMRELSYNTWGNLVRLPMIIAGIPAAYYYCESMGYPGILGALIAVSLSELPSYAVTAWGMMRVKLSTLRQDALATGAFVSIFALALLLRLAIGVELPQVEVTTDETQPATARSVLPAAELAQSPLPADENPVDAAESPAGRAARPTDVN